MNLEVLLQAASYVEAQEKKRKGKQKQEAAASTKPASPPVVTLPPPQPPPPQTVLITTVPPQTTVVKQERQEPTTSSGASSSNRRYIHNSFDLINPIMVDKSNGTTEFKRKPPPMVFRAGTREVHNKLEKYRRAQLKECFDSLKKELPPNEDEKKSSNLSILHSAIKTIHLLEKKERELEREMERLAREKIGRQQKIMTLKKELPAGVKLPPEPVLPEVDEDLVRTSKIEKVHIPLLANTQISFGTTQVGTVKEVGQQQPLHQTSALPVVPVAAFPVPQGLVLQRFALVQKPGSVVQTHFIAQPPTNGKVVTQYVVKPVVVVSRPS